MKQEKIYQIKDMPFPSQVQKVLDKHHIWSSYTLCQMTYEQVASLDGILPAYMLDIERVLNQYGFVLAGYVTQGEVSDEESDMSFDDNQRYAVPLWV